MSQYLSKSDFKLARTCPTKLYFKKKKYPTTMDDDAYLQLLAKGGYMIEAIAHLLYPDGVEVEHTAGTEAAVVETKRLLAEGHTELFEPTFISGGKLVRVDIFRMIGDTIELIEVKAKSWDSDDPGQMFLKRGTGLQTKWEPYVADVAYQKRVLEEVFPDHRVIPYLMMPDKSKTSSIDLLHRNFDIKQTTHPATGYTSYDITFTGDADELRADHFLTRVNVEEEVAMIEAQIDQEMALLLDVALPELTHVDTPLSKHCRSCEFRTTDYESSGFAECWGDLGRQEHHIFDLYYGTTIPGLNGFLFDEAIERGQASLLDLDESQFRNKAGKIGTRNIRQIAQLTNTRNNTEWQDGGLAREMANCTYPLHFIDFETSTMAIPYHAGMQPYEVVSFQWSCHTIETRGAAPVHTEWINTEDVFPNFEFARSLRDQVGNEGSILIWSSHEKTILKHIRAQMDKRYFFDQDLSDWIDETLAGDRIADMYKWCVDYYFHPLMKGRTSIKNVCDAVWQTDAEVRAEFPEYHAADESGGLVSPYDSLPAVRVHGREMDISVGTDAVTAYQSLLYGLDRDDEEARRAITEGLLTYCKLDTASMVMIWRHWAG